MTAYINPNSIYSFCLSVNVYMKRLNITNSKHVIVILFQQQLY